MILLKDIIIILFLAILIILITTRLKIPPIIGFLLTGIVIGPSMLQIVESISEIEVLAESLNTFLVRNLLNNYTAIP